MQETCEYMAGIATGDITPPVGTTLCGFAARKLHTSTGIYHPLRCVAIAIGDGKQDVLILSAELVFFEGIAEMVRGRISQATGLSPSAIILIGTHTHCGPSVRELDCERHGWIDSDYVHRAINAMADCARKASAYRFPARLKFGVGQCDFAVSRRRPLADNPARAGWGPYPAGEHDHEVSVLSIEGEEGAVRGILFSYACHPTSRGGLQVGGDYPGFAYDRIQEAFDFAQPAFLQGCGADQKPVPADPQATTFVPRTIAQTRAIGELLGDAVIAVLRGGGMDSVRGAIALNRSILNLQTEPLNPPALEQTLEQGASEVERAWARHHLGRLAAGLPEERAVPMEVQTLRFGTSLAVTALAAEAVAGYALRQKKELRCHFRHVMPLAYANDVIGYIPVRSQIPAGGYEVESANQFRRRTGPFVADTEDQILACLGAMLNAGQAD